MVNVYGSTPPTTTSGSTPGPTGILTSFSVSSTGSLTAIRYYSVPSPSTDTLSVIVYGAGVNNQTQLSSTTFVPSGSVGWQTVTLPSPVALTAGLVYTINVGLLAGTYKYGYTLGALPDSANGITIHNSGVRTGSGWAENSTTTLPDSDAYGFDFEITLTVPLDVSVGPDRNSLTGDAEAIEITATGGSGTKTYAWTKQSGPAGTFADATDPTTTFTPTAAGSFVLRGTVTDTSGSDFDEFTLTVTDEPVVAYYSGAGPETGWTVFGGTLPGVLSDVDDDTGVRSTDGNPTALVYDDLLTGVAVPEAGEPVTLEVDARVLDGTGTLTASVYDGVTLIWTDSDPIPVGTVGTVTFIIPAVDAADVSTGTWATGLRLVLSVTATS